MRDLFLKLNKVEIVPQKARWVNYNIPTIIKTGLLMETNLLGFGYHTLHV